MGYESPTAWPLGRLYSVTTFSTLGTVATPHVLFSLSIAQGAGVTAKIVELSVSQDATAAVATTAPILELGKIADLTITTISGGSSLTARKNAYNGGTASSAGVVVLGDTASDGGVNTALGGAGAAVYRAYGIRLASAAGQVHHHDRTLMPCDCAPVIVRGNEAISVAVVGADVVTNAYLVRCVWAEEAA